MLKTFDFDRIPIVEVVNEILIDAVKRNASDIHFDPYDEFLKVRIRIDGELLDYASIPNTLRKNLITRVKIISGMNITETRLPQDGAIKTKLRDTNLDLRVSSMPTNLGEKIVIRILDYSMSLKGIEYLGFSESNYKKLIDMIQTPNGIILVTGATGSGKSTTVYSILQKLNSTDRNLIAVEDPIEMEIEGINQIQVNSDIGLTFASCLRSILRQDPDIIMIGEIRDTETAKIAVRASITGHLVLSTLHTNTSLNTIER
ncbi:MAG: GspE/PulE family protein, partial [Bacilli bacterium]|nr:GspE/PulE family protein [Bacilli bacterium]